MMKKYTEYKESGVEWLGEVPKHWEVKQLKFVANLRSGNSITSDYIKTEGTYPVYGGNGLRGFTSSFTHDGKFALIGRQGALCGNINYAEGKFWASEHAVVATLKSNTNVFWFGELLRSMNLGQYSISAAQPGLAVERIQTLYLPYPSESEQTAIATFLDQKTSQIDSLIANKKRMIDLLKEERAAIINHAVIKGINPDAEYKDSGVEWLGKVPKHWEIARLKSLSRIRYGLGQPPKLQENGLPMIRATNVDHGRIIEKDLLFVSPEDIPVERQPYLHEGEIIVVRSGAYTADSAIIPAKYEGAIAGYDMVVTPQKVNCFFLSYCLLSQYIQKYQMDLHKLRAAQPHLNAEDLGAIIIIVPPEDEQKQIAIYIKNKLANIDQTVSIALKEITLFEEYRTALINETVTGKIDVRGNS
jgi:type I restriction enzyme, S subunit